MCLMMLGTKDGVTMGQYYMVGPNNTFEIQLKTLIRKIFNIQFFIEKFMSPTRELRTTIMM